MSTRFKVNPYPECTKERGLLYSLNGKIEPSLLEKTNELVSKLLCKIDENLDDLSERDQSIYTGLTGIALMYFLLAVKEKNDTFLLKAMSICEKAKNRPIKRFNFLNGNGGPLALGAVLHHVSGNSARSSEYIERLLSLVDLTHDSTHPDEILYGRAGYLYALLYVNKMTLNETVERKYIRKVVEEIINSGLNLAKKRPEMGVPLLYEWHDKIYLGAAHGVCGILYMLLCARNYLTEDELNNLVRPTIDWLLTFRYEGGNFASSVGSDSDRLVQWCHGAPGFVYLFTVASQVFNEPSYMQVALKCGNIVWERGLLSKGYSICHGVSGNAYTFLNLYKVTKDELHLYRAMCFMHYCLKYPKHEGLPPDRPFSMFEGMAGLVHFLTDMKDPSNALFPGFEL